MYRGSDGKTMNMYPEKLRNEYLECCLKASDCKSTADRYATIGIVTLSTCHYNGIKDARYVVLGALLPCVKK